MNGKELESINIRRMSYKEENKHKETSIKYGNEGDKKTSGNPEKKKNNMVVILICMNAVNTSVIQRMSAREKQHVYLS